MRKKSPKQTSIEGKSVVPLNALKDGLFSKELVLKQAGERQEDFDKLKNEFWDCIKPENAIEERAVVDAVHNRWWMERVRRAQAVAVKELLGAEKVISLNASDLEQDIEDMDLSQFNQARVQWTMAILAEFDRFSRAESAFERRYYRALAMLSAMRRAANSKSDLDSRAVSEDTTKSSDSGTKSPDGGTKT
jgi:hypothetical protein